MSRALREFINQQTPKGRWISRNPDYPPMTQVELALHDDMIDAEELADCDPDDEFDDPDADGYGWERHALRGAYANG